MNGYESYHPAVQFLYYALAVGFSMVSMHPVVIAAPNWRNAVVQHPKYSSQNCRRIVFFLLSVFYAGSDESDIYSQR